MKSDDSAISLQREKASKSVEFNFSSNSRRKVEGVMMMTVMTMMIMKKRVKCETAALIVLTPSLGCAVHSISKYFVYILCIWNSPSPCFVCVLQWRFFLLSLRSSIRIVCVQKCTLVSQQNFHDVEFEIFVRVCLHLPFRILLSSSLIINVAQLSLTLDFFFTIF